MARRDEFNIAIIAFIAIISYCQSQSSDPIVKTINGAISGSWKVSTNGRIYASFQGIPYAAPPVGKHRFREPVKPKPWIGTWDARKPGSGCLQYDPFSLDKNNMIAGSEDCLFINVYTPQLIQDASLPVIAFIHGGAFMFGSSAFYGADNFMDRDVVFVTFNYRLGPLGFLSTGDDVVPGNMGLKDQAFALKWIKENIKMFGGNPESITLTGLSAGGASVQYHYLSPLSSGSFNRGVAISGTSFSSWTQQPKPLHKTKRLADHLGCPTEPIKDMVECLRQRPASNLVQGQTIFFEWTSNWFTVFTPTIEAPNVKGYFINKHPYLIAKSGLAHKLPLIASVTTEEGLYPGAAYAHQNLLEDIEANWEQLASYLFVYNDTLPSYKREEVAQKIKAEYLEGKAIDKSTYPDLIRALSDRMFVSDVGKMVEIHAQTSGQPTYLYRFAFRGEGSLSNLMAENDENYGVSHGDDVFHLIKYPNINFDTTDDHKITDVLLDLYCSYATNGVPQSQGVQWTPVTKGSRQLDFLEIESPNQLVMKSMKVDEFGKRTFWDSLGFFENDRAHLLPVRDEL